MTPNIISKSDSEFSHQAAVFAYAAVVRLYGWIIADNWCLSGQIEGTEYASPVPQLEWLHAIHNAGHGDAIRGARAKAEGVRKGVADIFLPYPVYPWHGLYIELKRPTHKPKRSIVGKGGLSEAQTSFAKYAISVGYGWVVCYGWRHCVDTIKGYINYGQNAMHTG